MSRVGGAAQTKIIKKLGGGIRIALAQYRELAALRRLPLIWTMRLARSEHGQRVTELMKQKQYSPSPLRRWRYRSMQPMRDTSKISS